MTPKEKEITTTAIIALMPYKMQQIQHFVLPIMDFENEADLMDIVINYLSNSEVEILFHRLTQSE